MESASHSLHSCGRLTAIPLDSGREVFLSPGTPERVQPGAVALALGPASASLPRGPHPVPREPTCLPSGSLRSQASLHPPGPVHTPQTGPPCCCPLHSMSLKRTHDVTTRTSGRTLGPPVSIPCTLSKPTPNCIPITHSLAGLSSRPEPLRARHLPVLMFPAQAHIA